MSSEKMTTPIVENIKTSNRGYKLTCEIRNVPVSFPNAVRRILLANIPTVVIRDVEILENTTQMPHEMLKHRIEMLPVNVNPSDVTIIRDAKIELKILPENKNRTITTDDFVIESGRDHVLMRDRDLNTPLLFLYTRPNETLHIRGRLAVESMNVSQVCTATTSWKVDEELSKVDKKKFVEDGGDPRTFDNFYVQKSYHRDEHGRPNWFNLSIESVGVLQARDILKHVVPILRKNIDEFMNEALENIQRGQDEFTITLERTGHWKHTLGYLFQEAMYSDNNVGFVAYDIPHPLRDTVILRFSTKKSPESVLKTARDTIEEYCSVLEKAV